TYKKNLEILNAALKPEVEARKLLIQSNDAEKEIVIYIDTKNVFEAGRAQIKSDFDDTAKKIARALDSVKGKILISGHSDFDRIPSSSSFGNHLELSSARATQVG